MDRRKVIMKFGDATCLLEFDPEWYEGRWLVFGPGDDGFVLAEYTRDDFDEFLSQGAVIAEIDLDDGPFVAFVTSYNRWFDDGGVLDYVFRFDTQVARDAWIAGFNRGGKHTNEIAYQYPDDAVTEFDDEIKRRIAANRFDFL
jgi:hypothetical protein